MSNDVWVPEDWGWVRISWRPTWSAIISCRCPSDMSWYWHSWWTKLKVHWLHWHLRFHLQRRLSWTQLSKVFPRLLLFCHLKHDPLSNILSLLKQLRPNHLLARINLDPLVVFVLSFSLSFLNHLKTSLIHFLLHLFFRLTIAPLTIHIDSQILFVWCMIEHLIEVSVHAQRLICRSTWLFGVLQGKVGEGRRLLVSVGEKLINEGAGVVAEATVLSRVRQLKSLGREELSQSGGV